MYQYYYDLLHLKWVNFIFQIKYYKYKSISNTTLFIILNDITLWIFSNLKYKILTINSQKKKKKLLNYEMDSLPFKVERISFYSAPKALFKELYNSHTEKINSTNY